jgi:hypothetical protein
MFENSMNSRNSRNSRNYVNFLLFVLPFLIFALCFLLYASSLEAKITGGSCSNCHTMHNSQNGTFVVLEGPQRYLLNKFGCLGCHGQYPSGSINIVSLGNVPQVLHAATIDLAGGNFAYITGAKTRGAGTDSNTAGHNVVDTGIPDTNYTAVGAKIPPGDQHSVGDDIKLNNFTCAGQYGCHGDRSESDKLLAIKGAHHTDDTVLKFGSIAEGSQGSSTGLSYRFLNGVHGGEDSDWQKTTGSTDHNEYKGATSMGSSSATTPAGNTISGLCAECHGNFHGDASDIGGGDIGTASPWLRHPTDYVLPSDTNKEYRLYNSGTGTNDPYSLVAPVARVNIPNSASGVATPGTNDAIVMCLSCHRAHASPYFKMMRWDYKGWPKSGTNGCSICHTSKI